MYWYHVMGGGGGAEPRTRTDALEPALAGLGDTTARRESLAFTALVFIQLASVWSCDVFATQDGAVHLLNARVLFDYDFFYD